MDTDGVFSLSPIFQSRKEEGAKDVETSGGRKEEGGRVVSPFLLALMSVCLSRFTSVGWSSNNGCYCLPNSCCCDGDGGKSGLD